MYQGILQKDENGWYTDTGEPLTDLQALLDALPVGSKLFLQAPDIDESGAQEDDPTLLERKRAEQAELERLRRLRKSGHRGITGRLTYLTQLRHSRGK